MTEKKIKVLLDIWFQVGALSPESLRKRSEVLLAEKAAKSDRETSVVVSPSKKKKSTFSPSGSPSSNTSSNGLKVKRSKIADEGDLEKKEGLQADPPLMIPLSPSIKFMDESTDSTTKINTIGGGGGMSYFSPFSFYSSANFLKAPFESTLKPEQKIGVGLFVHNSPMFDEYQSQLA